MQLRHQHWRAELVSTQDPVKSFDDRAPRLRNPMPLRALEERRSHSVLMDRIDFVEVDNQSGCCIVEPWPLSVGTLAGNQFSGAGIGEFDCASDIHHIAV